MQYPPSIQKLIDMFKNLPTVGPKTAERYVFYLFERDPEMLQEFAQAIAELKEKTAICSSCHAIAGASPCAICSDRQRNSSDICVIADTRDLTAIENTGQFRGIYHVLGGVIDTVNGIKPEQLNVKTLVSRIKRTGAEEAILALDPTIEGETTAMYLIKLLAKYFPKLKVTRLAKGLPMGADLEYADEITLGNALKYRR